MKEWAKVIKNAGVETAKLRASAASLEVS